MKSGVRVGLGLVVLLLSTQGTAWASSGGINGFTGQFGSYCNVCHTPSGSQPTVTILGPTVVAPGSLNTYSLVISNMDLFQSGGGFDVSTDGGVLAVNPGETGTQFQFLEVFHTTPRAKSSGTVSWLFDWTAPISSGTFTLFGAGNAVNGSSGNNGDHANITSLPITVASATTPGESSGDGLPELIVSAVNQTTEDISIDYGTACDTTSNNIYYGPLDQVGTYSYSGEECNIGTSGSHSGFNPGVGDSFFFLVVGTKGTDEGSYGMDAQTAVPAERPAFGANLCGQLQTLADRCD